MVVVALVGLTGCSAGADQPIAVGPDTIVIDVRTPGEFAAGHLEGARLLDLNGGELEKALPELDPDAEYVVYCRSGNRSGQAKALMEKAGIADVTNLGSLESAAKTTGLPVVR
ncbi:MAG: rhodanese-like domain-containing protein [Nigerium sp.]|nr:rhodanese-like domain-containing protein [Nigerium sp.]